ncbi:hypothetical protein BGZ60DRAFT_245640 [Tricladium varicosporioides]|nr:hypothetical protein BGZ60DRAFT_245640 [Hymenoscyphus varicosporioides]
MDFIFQTNIVNQDYFNVPLDSHMTIDIVRFPGSKEPRVIENSRKGISDKDINDWILQEGCFRNHRVESNVVSRSRLLPAAYVEELEGIIAFLYLHRPCIASCEHGIFQIYFSEFMSRNIKQFCNSIFRTQIQNEESLFEVKLTGPGIIFFRYRITKRLVQPTPYALGLMHRRHQKYSPICVITLI